MNQAQLQAIQESDLFDDVALLRESGYAEHGASTDSLKPYVYVTKLNETGFETMQLELVEGRFPSGPDEVIVSEQLTDIGSEIDLEMGERVAEDITFDGERTHAYALHTLNGERAERLTNVTEDSFNVVGVVRELSGSILGHQVTLLSVILMKAKLQTAAQRWRTCQSGMWTVRFMIK